MAVRGINKVILIGNLGQDPELRYMPNGNAVTNITLATSESWRDKQTGEIKEQTEWHRVVIFGKLAEIASEYLRKGSQVYIEGCLRTRKWTDQSGQDRYTTEVVVNINGSMQMLGNRRGLNSQQSEININNSSDKEDNNWDRKYQRSHEKTEHNEIGKKLPLSDTISHKESSIDFDDDIPF